MLLAAATILGVLLKLAPQYAAQGYASASYPLGADVIPYPYQELAYYPQYDQLYYSPDLGYYQLAAAYEGVSYPGSYYEPVQYADQQLKYLYEPYQEVIYQQAAVDPYQNEYQYTYKYPEPAHTAAPSASITYQDYPAEVYYQDVNVGYANPQLTPTDAQIYRYTPYYYYYYENVAPYSTVEPVYAFRDRSSLLDNFLKLQRAMKIYGRLDEKLTGFDLHKKKSYSSEETSASQTSDEDDDDSEEDDDDDSEEDDEDDDDDDSSEIRKPSTASPYSQTQRVLEHDLVNPKTSVHFDKGKHSYPHTQQSDPDKSKTNIKKLTKQVSKTNDSTTKPDHEGASTRLPKKSKSSIESTDKTSGEDPSKTSAEVKKSTVEDTTQHSVESSTSSDATTNKTESAVTISKKVRRKTRSVPILQEYQLESPAERNAENN